MKIIFYLPFSYIYSFYNYFYNYKLSKTYVFLVFLYDLVFYFKFCFQKSLL